MAEQTNSEGREHLSVLIVGGGVAGLHTALRLVEAGEKSIKLFEGRGGVGGRIKTTRDGDGKPLFNDFAWRIGETNTHMHALVKELGVEIRDQVTPDNSEKKAADSTVKKIWRKLKGSQCDGGADDKHADMIHRETPNGRAPLSVYATHCLSSTNGADQQDRESGYAGRSAQIAFPGESHGTRNCVVVNGMNEIPNKLAEKLPEGVVHLNHRCKDVRKLDDGKYLVDIMARSGDTYQLVSYTCDTLVLAAPPLSLRGFTIAKEGLEPVLFAVHERRLMHCYAWSKSENVPDRSDVEDRIYKGFPDSILQQVVSGDYGNGTFQAAYACDRFERVWRELQFQGPDIVKAEVNKQLAKIALPRLKGVEIDKVQICSGFVHRWQLEAHVNGKTKEELEAMAVYPSPVRLPRLHLVGEAFSSQQGWTEGALLTSMVAVDHILKNPMTSASKYAQPIPALERKKGGDQMRYKGIVVDVSEWRERHPGGSGMIFGHGNEDISELFDNYHGGWPAPLATMFGLQMGIDDK